MDENESKIKSQFLRRSAETFQLQFESSLSVMREINEFDYSESEEKKW